ncbi:MAG TPA: PIG-L family deacetylase [Pyrinomonadaceae bacterium]|nr:PIG-L family deacetylase [Pyrinomonadaceae bacterium]
MKLLLSPHNDDECLFAAYTIMRDKPLVIIVTDSNAQLAESITADQRREESRRACELLGVPVAFLGLKDGTLKQQKADLERRLEPFASQPWTHVYAPAVQGGHNDHDALGDVVSSMFSEVSYYATYAEGEFFTPAGREIEPTQEQVERKNRALECYRSQIGLPQNKCHFDAVRGRAEYLGGTARPRR